MEFGFNFPHKINFAMQDHDIAIVWPMISQQNFDHNVVTLSPIDN